MSRDTEAIHARYRQVLAWRAAGMPSPEMGWRLGVTRERARGLTLQAQRWQERMQGTPAGPAALTPEMPMDALPIAPTAKKRLRRAGLRTVGEVTALSDAALLGLRDIGPRTVAAIRAAVAAPAQADDRREERG